VPLRARETAHALGQRLVEAVDAVSDSGTRVTA
jgi:hypothetical protein